MSTLLKYIVSASQQVPNDKYEKNYLIWHLNRYPFKKLNLSQLRAINDILPK
jgi:hypothetical protein